MPAAPKPEIENERLKALLSYDILDTNPSDEFDDLTTLVSKIFNVPVSVVSLVDKDRQWFKSCYGIDTSETSRDHAFCAHTILESKTLVIENATLDPRVKDSPLVTDDPKIRFYAGAPIINSDGYALGSLCAIDFIPRKVTLEQIQILETIAKQVVSQMELHKNLISLKEYTIKIEEARQVAQEATKVKSMFLSNMSHELRTPLTSIIGYAEDLHEDKLSVSEYREGLKIIMSNGRHLLQLINDILDISKIEVGKLIVENIPCSPDKLLTDIQSVIQPQALGKGLKFSIKFNNKLPFAVKTDPTRLKQILINLLGNAVKFTKEGEIVLSASYIEDSKMLEFKVVDTGIGLTEEQIAVLFDSFTQANKNTARLFGGTGLGLSISKELAIKLGGDILVESTLDQGSCFTVTIIAEPASRSELEERIRNSSGVLAPSSKVKSGQFDTNQKKKILLAEDTVTNQKLVSRILIKMGYEVSVVDNGQEAVALAADQEFSLILMDLNMPVMDGFEATRLLRKQGLTTPIVALTANAFSHDVDQCMQEGFSGHIAKPFERAKFIKKVETVIENNSFP